jgi:hypothetical protein
MFRHIHKFLPLLLALCASSLLTRAQDSFPTLHIQTDDSIPKLRIMPDDIVQDSVHQLHIGTNRLAVLWTWTEAGAKKALGFWELHAGQRTAIQIGTFESPPGLSMRHDPATYPNWKEGWLKRRTDKAIVNNAEDAKAIVKGLTKGSQ